ncbi:unnamed protein product [Adineta steineri]|uniref:Uncharacterized protein n=1 Tax=Adineta steineri TaxID=433720 RepID=A0A818H6U0_9BILA|nr:unnamed protein product [Adineta steineri]CAF0897359.1 unnamed protein product [Adineta steineri]CAF3500153.1 unnamed protein product [Adineta steineri]
MGELLWGSIVQLNLFKSSLRQQPVEIQQQRWTTRLYVILLGIALFILIFYFMLKLEARIIQVPNPTLQTVKQLQQSQINNYISSLQCGCTQLSAAYGQLIQLQPFYHQVCSSDFVSQHWITAVAKTIHAISTENYYLDFHNTAPLFHLLKSICDFSQETVMNSLQTFEQTQVISAELISVDLFTNQMITAIDKFKQDTTNKFVRFLLTLRNLTYVNQILTGSFSNFDVEVANSPAHAAALSLWYYTNNIDNFSTTCSCGNDSSCKTVTGIYTGQHGQWILQYLIPGLYTACFPIESLLQSTLECFYDTQGCLTFLIHYYNASFFSNFTKLNSSSSASRFAINSTIGILLGELFIEKWSEFLNYTGYFAQCQPASCSYQISRSNTIVETITTIIALYGGLTVALSTIAPLIITMYVKLSRQRLGQQQVPAETSKYMFT